MPTTIFGPSIPQLLMPLIGGSEDVQNMQICLHFVFWCPVVTIVCRMRYGQVFATCNLLALCVARKHGLV